MLEGWAWKKFSIWNNRTGGTGAVHKSTLLWRSARPARLPNPSRQRAQILTLSVCSGGVTLAAVAMLERQLPRETVHAPSPPARNFKD